MTTFYVELTTNCSSGETIDCTPLDDMGAHFELMHLEQGCIYAGDCPDGSYYFGSIMDIPVGLIEHGLTQKQAAEIVCNVLPPYPILCELAAALESGSVKQWPGQSDLAAFYALHEDAVNRPPDSEIQIPY